MHPDFLTFTTKSPALARKLYGLVIADRANKPVSRRFLGATGVQVGKIFVGHWDNGRWLCSASGDSASVPWAALVDEELDEDDWSVARVDLQTTIVVADADQIILNLKPHSRYKALRLSPVGARGQTLYVGSPSSDKRLRVYNKSVESGFEIATGDLLRVELQLRNGYADYALMTAKANSRQSFYTWWRESVLWMAAGLDQALPVAEAAHVRMPEVGVNRTYADWIRRCVIPALAKARLDSDWEVVREEILAALD